MSKEFAYKIEYEVDKDTGHVLASIPELNHLSSFGETFAEAEANIREAALGYAEATSFSRKKTRWLPYRCTAQKIFQLGRYITLSCTKHV